MFTKPYHRVASLIAAFLISLHVAGCAQQRVVPNPFEVDASEYDRLFDASIRVLRDQGFRIDRKDYRFGRITALPLGSPTVFEPWQPSNSTAGQSVESTINDERRNVTIFLEPRDTAVAATADTDAAATQPQPEMAPTTNTSGTYLLRIEVVMERLEVPTRQLIGTTRGEHLLTNFHATPTELHERGINGPYWQPLGRDPYLEQRLLAAIVRESVKAR